MFGGHFVGAEKEFGAFWANLLRKRVVLTAELCKLYLGSPTLDDCEIEKSHNRSKKPHGMFRFPNVNAAANVMVYPWFH